MANPKGHVFVDETIDPVCWSMVLHHDEFVGQSESTSCGLTGLLQILPNTRKRNVMAAVGVGAVVGDGSVG